MSTPVSFANISLFLAVLGRHGVDGQDAFLSSRRATFGTSVAKPHPHHDGWTRQFTPKFHESGFPTLCMDLSDYVDWNGNLVIASHCTGARNQLWFYDDDLQIRFAGNADKCLDGGSFMDEGEIITIWDCNGQPQQQWGYDEDLQTVYLINSNSDASLCLGVDLAHPPQLTLQDCGAKSFFAQQWDIYNGVAIRAGYDDGHCLEISDGGVDNGTPIVWGNCYQTRNQRWIFTNFKIMLAQDNSKCLDAGSMDQGMALWLWDCLDVPAQNWAYDSDLRTLFLSSGKDTSVCLDISDGNSASGNKVFIWECNGCWNQRFTVYGPGSFGTPDEYDPIINPGYCPSFGPPPPPAPPAPTPPAPTPPGPVMDHCKYGSGGMWPRFENEDELKNDEKWSQYFASVYGTVPNAGYPICISSLSLIYSPAMRHAFPDNAPSKECPTKAGEYYWRMTPLQAPYQSWIWNPLFFEALPDDVWVEVAHQKFHDEVRGAWLFYAPGSAIWINTGKTKAYNDHPDAADDLLGPGQCKDNQCLDLLDIFVTVSLNRGFNTMQFLEHADMSCGRDFGGSGKNGAIEIVYNAGSGQYSCGSSTQDKTIFRAGWEASRDCVCDNQAENYANCAGFGNANS